MYNEKDQYIKQRLKEDQLISKKADDIFNEFLNSNIKTKLKNKNKSKKLKYPKIISTAACLILVFLAANVYATTQGYENVFFMIKYLSSGENIIVDNKDDLLSDRDIAISYELIKITENIEIQIANLQIKDKETKLLVVVNEEKLEKDEDIVPLRYKVYNSSNKQLCNQKSIKAEKGQKSNATYTEELVLKNYNKNEDTLKLEIYKSNSDLITTITIDINTKSIVVSGEQEALNKISEIELKEFLGNVAGYTNECEGFTRDELKICLAQNLLSMADKLEKHKLESYENEAVKVEDINKMLQSFCGEKIENFEEGDFYTKCNVNGTDYFVVKNGFDLVLTGNCMDIPKISYCGGLYTVTYTYCYLGESSIFEVDINDYNIYQNTVTIKLNENNEYSKFQIVSIDKPVIIKSSEEKEVGKIEIKDTTTDIKSENNTDVENDNTLEKDDEYILSTEEEVKVDNYASTMSWTEYWAPGLKLKYPTSFNLEEIGGYERGFRQGEVATKITGVATGINPDTKEIVESNMTIEIYEPEYIEDGNEEEYFEKVSNEFSTDGVKGIVQTTNDGLKWNTTSKIEEGITTIIYNNYSNEWGRKIVITTDNADNYKVINILNWMLGATKVTSY